ncbi:MAG: hypothetical protein K2Y21_16410 [Phycisphaerales bacterium]|nr:hypothetical protein [Phycisphaerales bacterium]
MVDPLCRHRLARSSRFPQHRNAKYNQLLRIAEELGDSAIYGKNMWTKG